MGGDPLEVAELGWHRIEGDRRLAFRRIDDRSGFPWLTASKLPDLLLFAPDRREDGAAVTRIGRLVVGQIVLFPAATERNPA